MTKKIGLGRNKAYKFKENNIVYSKSKNTYAQVKSFDETAKIYACKIIKSDGSPSEEAKLPEDDVSKFIYIKVVLTSASKFEGADSVEHSM